MGLRFIFLFAVLGATSCHRPADYAIVGSADVPSVQGDVEIEKIADNIYVVDGGMQIKEINSMAKLVQKLTDEMN